MKNNLVSLTLEFVKKLRSHRKPKKLDDPSKGIPISTLKWIMENMKVNSAVMYIYSSSGRAAIKKKILGDISLWKKIDFDQLENYQQKGSQKLLLKVTCKLRGKQHSSEPVGYLGVYRNTAFNDTEYYSLLDVANFLGDYMYEIFYINRMQYYNLAIEKINEIDNWKKQPGTIIKNIQGVIHRAIRAHASYLAIFCNENIIVEYFQKPNWNRPRFVENHQIFQLSATFEQLCKKETFFQWVDLTPEKPLMEILKIYVPEKKDEWEYLIGINKNDGIPLALWIFQFRRRQLVFLDLYENLILYGIGKAQRIINYLFQRRTKKLIVDPIFRCRDTKMDNNLAFIIMPFSESWSSRIWERFIKPIVNEEGLRAIRADDLYGRDIMEDIWGGILACRVVIADITGRNPNVFYELGIAHTIGKQVILLTQNLKDIPFDLNRYRHIIYEDNYDGYDKLKSQLKASLGEILKSNSQ